MTTFAASKVLAALPGTLAPDTVYAVRVGAGFDLYITDSTGAVAYKSNAAPPAGIPIRPTQPGGNYTFVLADANTCTPFSAEANATIPQNSAVPFPIGTRLYVQGASVGIYQSTGNPLAGGASGTFAAGEWLCAIQTSTDQWSIYPFIASAFQHPSVIDDSINSIQLVLYGNDLFNVSLTNNVTTFTIQQGLFLVTPSPYGTTFAMRFLQPASGGPYTVAWPSNFHFLAGSDTAIQSGAGAYTMLAGTTFDGGARYECVMRACGA